MIRGGDEAGCSCCGADEEGGPAHAQEADASQAQTSHAHAADVSQTHVPQSHAAGRCADRCNPRVEKPSLCGEVVKLFMMLCGWPFVGRQGPAGLIATELRRQRGGQNWLVARVTCAPACGWRRGTPHLNERIAISHLCRRQEHDAYWK